MIGLYGLCLGGFLTSPIASLDNGLSRNPLGSDSFDYSCRTGLAGCADGKLSEAQSRRMLDEKLRGLRLGASELSTMSERGFGDSGLAGWGGLGKDVVTAHHGSGGRGCSCCSGSYGSYGGEGRGCGNRCV